MVTVWKIAPGENARVWEDTHKQGCITINWMNDTDYKQFLMQFETREARKKALMEAEGTGGHMSADSILYFVYDIQEGDTVVANRGKRQIIGIGKVTSEYLPRNDDSNRNPRKGAEEHCQARLVDWQIDKSIDLDENFFTHFIPPTVLKLGSAQCHKIKQAYLDQYKTDPKLPELKSKLDRLLPDDGTQPPINGNGTTMKTLLEQFGQIIAYGPPGTGKTREAKRVALAMLSGEETDENATDDEIEQRLKPYREKNCYDLVVFHPAYEYEQFVGGIVPREGEGRQLAFQTEPGVFLRLCRAVQNDSPSVLIIDEINRGSLPKLLGELVYALEYRGHEVTLPFEYKGSRILSIPKNLFVIATMNSADRSIGHIDVAIRRRFGLLHLRARSDAVRKVWQRIEEAEYGNRLANLLDELNRDLHRGNDRTAEAELGVGHSYFLPKAKSFGEEAKHQVSMKWTHQVQPLLREYAQLLNLEANSLDKYFKTLESLLAHS